MMMVGPRSQWGEGGERCQDVKQENGGCQAFMLVFGLGLGCSTVQNQSVCLSVCLSFHHVMSCHVEIPSVCFFPPILLLFFQLSLLFNNYDINDVHPNATPPSDDTVVPVVLLCACGQSINERLPSVCPSLFHVQNAGMHAI